MPLGLGRWYRLVNHQLSLAGATFVKLGQWTSTRPDILPPELCKVLSGLHYQAPTHPFAHTRSKIEEGFGKSMQELFIEFDELPIGSGCIGQVYKAKFHPDLGTGYEGILAVKVVHPGVLEKITIDLKLLSLVAGTLHLIPTLKWLNLPEEVQQFSQMMKQQIDLRYEALNLARFLWNFKKNKNVSFPRPLYPFVNENILVETFEEGFPISKFILPSNLEMNPMKMEALGNLNRKLIGLGFDSLLKMLLLDNFLHADLHPGNIFVQIYKRPSFLAHGHINSSNLKPAELLDQSGSMNFDKLATLLLKDSVEIRMLFLDAGLVSHLSKRHFHNFLDLFKELVIYQNGFQVGRLLIERSKYAIKDSSGIVMPYVSDPIEFCESIDEIVRSVLKGRHLIPKLDLSQIQLGGILLDVFHLVRKHHVRLDEEYTNMVMSLICVEGLGKQLLPHTDLYPFLRNAGFKYLAKGASKIAAD